MLKNKPLKIAVSGSLAYDKIMDFPGRFADHILPKQIHQLNLSFSLNKLRQSFGGTAGNIAYNLSLLNEKPIILGVVGSDFYTYKTWLLKQGLDLARIKVDPSDFTATAHIMTDRDDNQITSFYPGPRPKDYALASAQKLVKQNKITLAIIAPDDKSRMLAYASVYQKSKTPYIFDPGQALTAFNAQELKKAIKGAKILIGNDYEIKLISDRLKTSIQGLTKLAEMVIITKGAKGSEIHQLGREKINVKSAKPKNSSDPTGAGDAYRAGLLKGLILGYNLKTCAQLAGLIAVYTVEKYGTQTHKFSIQELKKRYYQNYQEKLIIWFTTSKILN